MWNRIHRRSRKEGETEDPDLQAIDFAGGDPCGVGPKQEERTYEPSCKSRAEGTTGGLML